MQMMFQPKKNNRKVLSEALQRQSSQRDGTISLEGHNSIYYSRTKIPGSIAVNFLISVVCYPDQ
jgi:hypothetical protein